MVAAMVVAVIESNAQNVYTFTVNNTAYTVNEESLDKKFGTMLDELHNTGNTSPKHFNLWSESYKQWKALAISCPLAWKLYGTHYAEPTRANCDKLPNEYLGLNKKGTTAIKGNPNDPNNQARRIALLNGMMMKYISEAIAKGQE